MTKIKGTEVAKSTSRPLVAYYRVSTKRQEASGLGLEGQKAAIDAYATQVGGTVVAKYQESESGRKADRPELKKALAHARRAGATLLIAKLDRLARNVAFLATLLEAGVDLVACDNPGANRLTLHVLAAVAEAEASAISQRTKDALAAYKVRGGKLGAARPECRNLTDEARAKGTKAAAAARTLKAREAYADIEDIVVEARADGESLREIAVHLNENEIPTPRGKTWGPVQVSRLLGRATKAR